MCQFEKENYIMNFKSKSNEFYPLTGLFTVNAYDGAEEATKMAIAEVKYLTMVGYYYYYY